MEEIITIYVIWVNTYSLISLDKSKKGKTGIDELQNNPVPTTNTIKKEK